MSKFSPAKLPKSYWAWEPILRMNQDGYWPYTPSTNLLYGLAESLDGLLGQGLEKVFARQRRWAAAALLAALACTLRVSGLFLVGALREISLAHGQSDLSHRFEGASNAKGGDDNRNRHDNKNNKRRGEKCKVKTLNARIHLLRRLNDDG